MGPAVVASRRADRADMICKLDPQARDQRVSHKLCDFPEGVGPSIGHAAADRSGRI
jgi:hypothetical protein